MQGTIYWLDVQVFSQAGMFGWMTSYEHWNDDGAWADAAFGGIPLLWNELRHPLTGESLDMAFALTTIPEPGAALLLGFAASILLVLRKRE